MKYQELTKHILAIGVGGLFILRPFIGSGTAVYPFSALVSDIIHYTPASNTAIVIGLIFDITHLAIGSLVISLGFEKLSKLRKPLFITTCVFLAAAMGSVWYLTRPYYG